MPTRDSIWYDLEISCSCLLMLLQISVVNDMSAIPIFMTESLSKAKGSYGNGAMQVKGVAYGTANLVSKSSEEKP